METFSSQPAELGESPVWHPQRCSLLWLDIIEKKLYEKKFSSCSLTIDKEWHLPEHASFMARDEFEPEILWMVTDKSFGKFSLVTGLYESLLKIPTNESFRANDGGISPDGHFWFGTMQWEPTGFLGGIYSISPDGELRDHNIAIGIPNTFCWSNDGKFLYISDSFNKVISAYSEVKGSAATPHREILHDFSSFEYTPDGGAMSSDDCLYNALWSGGSLAVIGSQGEMLSQLSVPALQATSCCFGGPNYQHLFITSAKVAMSMSDLKKYPESGCVFISERPCPGIPSKPFHLYL
jgi:L-arabinonolactonase